MKPIITEIDFVPVKPQKGLIGYVSFVYNHQLYLGNIGVFTRLSHNHKSAYRLTYPEDKVRKKSFFHPINKSTQEEIEFRVSSYIDDEVYKRAGSQARERGCL